jgi:glutathione S-transferase
MTDHVLTIVGMPGSPYSRKLRAVLRYRRIPHGWVHHGSPETRGLPQARVPLLPQLILRGPDGMLEAAVDSTPLIRRLEGMYADRSVIPPDPVMAFVDALLEDYADEWLTKPMFHYRWAFAPDAARAAAILPRWSRTNHPEPECVTMGKTFAERQIGRLGVVGSNATTAAVIEDSYRRVLRLLDAHLTRSRFVMGGRPGASDFGMFGQLTQLVGFDPTPAAIALEVAPRVVAWVDVVEDISGLEPSDADWRSRDDVPDTLRALLAEVGRVYVPFLIANADALERGATEVECTVDGRAWTQRPFPYQGKCLRWLREGHAALAADERRAVDALLRGTGCERLFAGSRE